jgi:hypothetical protein
MKLPDFLCGQLMCAHPLRAFESLTRTKIRIVSSAQGEQSYPTPAIVGTLADYNVINRPREIGLRMMFSF